MEEINELGRAMYSLVSFPDIKQIANTRLMGVSYAGISVLETIETILSAEKMRKRHVRITLLPFLRGYLSIAESWKWTESMML